MTESEGEELEKLEDKTPSTRVAATINQWKYAESAQLEARKQRNELSRQKQEANNRQLVKSGNKEALSKNAERRDRKTMDDRRSTTKRKLVFGTVVILSCS